MSLVPPSSASLSEARLMEVFSLVDRQAQGRFDDSSSVAFAVRACGLFIADSEIACLGCMTIAELREIVVQRSKKREYTRLSDFDTLRRPLRFLDRGGVGKVRREELIEGLCTAGDGMTPTDVLFVLKELKMHKDEFVDVDKFVRSLVLHPIWAGL